MRNSFLSFLFYSGILAKTSFPGLDIYTSPKQISLGGAGYLQTSPLSYFSNQPLYTGSLFSVSLVRYPASITSQAAGIIIPFMNGVGNFTIGNNTYGTFKGYDENGVFTKTYSSNDIWMKSAYGKTFNNLPISIGASSLFISSNYSNNKFHMLNFAGSFQVMLDSLNARFGLSFNNIVLPIGDLVIDVKTEIIFSIMKKLAYLPLNLYLDILFDYKSLNDIYLGGVFNVNKNLQFKLGSSTRKLEQNINKDLYKSIFGATGFGFCYFMKNFSIDYGLYLYGTGSVSQGLELGTKF